MKIFLGNLPSDMTKERLQDILPTSGRLLINFCVISTQGKFAFIDGCSEKDYLKIL